MKPELFFENSLFLSESLSSSQQTRLLETCNRASAPYGLELSAQALTQLLCERGNILHAAGRVEIGEGILPKLVATFCDSPFLCAANYEEMLSRLQEDFYLLKGECLEALNDDELLESMKLLFNGPAQGAPEILESVSVEQLMNPPEAEDFWEPDF